MKLGAAAHDAWRSSALVKLTLPEAPSKGEREKRVDFTFVLDRAALNKVPPRGPIPIRRSGGTSTCSCPTGANWSSLATQPEPDQHSLLAPTRMGPAQAGPTAHSAKSAVAV